MRPRLCACPAVCSAVVLVVHPGGCVCIKHLGALHALQHNVFLLAAAAHFCWQRLPNNYNNANEQGRSNPACIYHQPPGSLFNADPMISVVLLVRLLLSAAAT